MARAGSALSRSSRAARSIRSRRTIANGATLVDRALAHPPPAVPLAPAVLDRVDGHLRREHRRAVRLTELAALVGMAPFPFARAYHAAAGATTSETLVACRVEAAERLLRTTNWTTSRIAHTVGYESPRAFAADFEAVTGLSRAAYREVWRRPPRA